MCAHRGSTVEHRGCGSTRLLSCRFHGWSYNLDGSLRAASAAPLFSTETPAGGLRRLRCEERHGIVWVTADAGADPLTVREWLGAELDDLLAGLGLHAMVRHGAEDQGNINAGAVDSLQIGANESFILEHLAALDRLLAG